MLGNAAGDELLQLGGHVAGQAAAVGTALPLLQEGGEVSLHHPVQSRVLRLPGGINGRW